MAELRGIPLAQALLRARRLDPDRVAPDGIP